MECKDAGPLLAAAAYDDLTDAEREMLREHLKRCPSCARELEALCKLIGSPAERGEPAASFFAAQRASILRRLEDAPAARVGAPSWRWAPAAALLLAGVWWAGRVQRPAEPPTEWAVASDIDFLANLDLLEKWEAVDGRRA